MEKGEYLAFLGPTGCGKTSLMQSITGISTKAQGQILFNDYDISLLPVHKRKIGYVSQTSDLFPHLTVSENIAFGPRYLKLSYKERKSRLGHYIIAQLFFFICHALPPIAECEEWIALRGKIEGRASIKYDGKGGLKEWHYIYKTGRRYKMGLTVWASPALSIIGGKSMAFIGGYDQTLHALDLIHSL